MGVMYKNREGLDGIQMRNSLYSAPRPPDPPSQYSKGTCLYTKRFVCASLVIAWMKWVFISIRGEDEKGKSEVDARKHLLVPPRMMASARR